MTVGQDIQVFDIDENLLNQIKNLPIDLSGQQAIKLDPNSKIALELLNITKQLQNGEINVNKAQSEIEKFSDLSQVKVFNDLINQIDF